MDAKTQERTQKSAAGPSENAQTASCCAAHAKGTIPQGAQCSDQPLGRLGGIVHSYPLIDDLLEARRTVFGGNDPVFAGYRGHAYRILNFARQWTPPSPERDDKIAICAVFHDIAAWPNDNLDYLRPSADQADAHLDEIGRSAWKPEMRLMIESHHKITAYRGDQKEWVEPIRRADWCDVSFALLRFGLPRAFVDEVRAAFPIAPFYPQHVYKVSAKWALRHPLNPAPIFRW
ncbi:MAG: hypothetical protein ACREUE_03995 [Panacagrimonas sp.]